MWFSLQNLYRQIIEYGRGARDSLADAYQNTMDDLEHVTPAKRHHSSTPQAQEVHKDFDATSTPIRHIVDHTNAPRHKSFPTRKFWLVWLTVVAVWVGVYFASDLLFLIWAAFIIAMALENMILFFWNKMSRGWGITFSYLTFIVFLLSWVLLVVPFIITQAIDLWSLLIDNLADAQVMIQREGLDSIILDSSLPEFIKDGLVESVEEWGWATEIAQDAITNNIQQIVTFGSSSLRDAGSVVVTILSWFFSAAFQMGIVLILSVFFSIEKTSVIRAIGSISGQTTRVELLMVKLYRRLGYWLKGQLLLCLAIWIMVFTGLQIAAIFGFNLPNKITLSLIAGLTEFIPYAWPILGMIPALLVAAIEYGVGWVLVIAAVYLVIQQLENNVLVPMVMSQTLWASPLLIFICMIIGGSLLGFLWVLLAVPIAVIITILYETFIQQPHYESTV